MQKWILVSIMITLFTSCQSGPRYAKDVVELDNFDFGLNIDTFFEDESYFRTLSDNHMLSSSEEVLEDTTFSYFRYETSRYKLEKVLAKYKGVEFNGLNLLTDSTDQHVLLINGFKDNATPKEIKTVIDNLLKINPKPYYISAFMSGTSIIFQSNDRILSVYIDIPLDPKEKDYSDYDYYKNYTDEELEEMSKNYFTQSSYQELMQKAEDKGEEITLSLFVIDLTFDKIYNSKSRGSSGFMTQYKTKD